jgi:protease I
MTVAFLATDMVEQLELTEPWQAIERQGWTLELVSLRPGEIQAFHHDDRADTFPVDRLVREESAADDDALVVPGGVGNPDELRTDEHAVALVRRLTWWPSRRTDIRNAGGAWVDEAVVVDDGLVTSRRPTVAGSERRPPRRYSSSATRWR